MSLLHTIHCSLGSNENAMYLISRKETFVKLFFLISLSGLLMYVVLAFHTFHTAILNTSKMKAINALNKERFGMDMKYILLWTTPQFHFNLSKNGQRPFIHNNCSHLNCYLTTDKNLLSKDVRNFNSIVFHINTLQNWKKNMPTERSYTQKYVFYSMTSADKHPVCNLKADNFFNWTWSYKLHSDIVTPFIEVRDLNGEVVKKTDSDWPGTLEDTDNIDKLTNSFDFGDNLDTNENKVGNKTTISSYVLKYNKSKAVLWLKKTCDKGLQGVNFAERLQRELIQYSLDLDIIDIGCAVKKNPAEGYLKALERDYYFYLAQEDSFSEDYVTTEVLNAYQHNAVPIVVGGADYTKFLPFDSYIDAQHDTVEQLGAFITYIIRTPVAYKNYFNWKKFYTIHETNVERGYCGLCAMLNDNKSMRSSAYQNFRKWWFYGSLKKKCLPKGAESYNDVLSYINGPGDKKNKT